MTISQAKRQARIAEWVEKIRDQQISGITIRAWCAAQGFGEGQFYYWLKRVRELAIEHCKEQMPQTAALIKVEPERLPSVVPTLPMALATPQTGIVIGYGSTTVALPQGMPIAAVTELLKALNAP